MSEPDLYKSFLASLVVTIDGPAASGKTSTAQSVARQLGLRHIDTGAMYRAVTLEVLARNVDIGDDDAVAGVASAVRVDLLPGADEQRILLAGRDVTQEIRSEAVTSAVSRVSAVADVRRSLVRTQRRLLSGGGVVLEGRDTGSVVAPAADVKVYLDASLGERALRRQRELAGRGRNVSADEVAADLERRDRVDSERDASPLVCPVGAHRVDTSNVTVEQQSQRVVSIAHATAKTLASIARRGEENDPTRRRFSYAATQWVARTAATALFGMKVESLPNWHLGENYIFASNHRSNVDPPVVGSTFRRDTYFIAKSGLFRNSLFAAILRGVNAFPIRRGVFDREAVDYATSLLRHGKSLLIFPEGGRVHGMEFGRARSGVGLLAIRSGVPVVPIYIGGSLRLRSCLVRQSRVVVRYGRPIRIASGPLSELRARASRDEYRRFSQMVMAAIAALRDAGPDSPERKQRAPEAL